MSLRLRPARAGDLPRLVALFHASVHAVGAAHYAARELDAWAPADLAPADWAPRLARNRALVAEDAAKDAGEAGGDIVGFAELSPEGALDMLYVDRDRQGRGIASALLAALEAAARDAGHARLTVDASRAARPFFQRRGFALLGPRTVERRGVAIETFRMAKDLDS